MNTQAVIDFETTGLSPDHGARPTEIAVFMVSHDIISDLYQTFMNPGVPITYERDTWNDMAGHIIFTNS